MATIDLVARALAHADANEAFMRMVRVLTGKPPLSTKSRDLATEALVAVGLAHLKAQVSDALRRRLAAAQADAVALWSLLNAARDVCIAYVLANPKRGYAGQEQDPAGAHATLGRLTEALATPAPGTPLLDAVRALVEAADDQELAEGCECMDTMSGHSHPCAYLRLQDAMNAVRKVLP